MFLWQPLHFNPALGWFEDYATSPSIMEADGGTFLAECPQCQEVVDHTIIKRKKRGLGEDILVKCEGCQAVHTIIIGPLRRLLSTPHYPREKGEFQ
ncbi:MAG: hypothetical protein Ct9H90mP24_7430 [Methanobacteriota archaeon]|nr:MAG: hypothetical protein Ct9H90mP24_7430 [Euryarchaeota archaeon]